MNQALNYLNNQKLNPEIVINKVKIEMLWNRLVVKNFQKI